MKFEVNEHQLKLFKEWREQHDAKFHNGKSPYSGAIGGRWTWSFTPTGLGTVVRVKCGFAGLHPDDSELDLTPYEEW